MLHDTVTSISTFTGNLVRTILVVEDEELIRMFLTEFLQDCGYIVLEADNVAQAKRVLTDKHVDLVFSDVNMPGNETGFDLEKWVRRHYPETKILLTSGLPHGPESTMALLEPLLPKPYTCAAALRRIQALSQGQSPGAAI
jgi:CheY-like chemotaxis protein